MWNTADGVRKLRNAERRLMVIAVTGFQDQIAMEQDGGGFEFECEILNHSDQDDRWYLPLLVAEHLLGAGPAPEVRAWNAALIHEVFSWMRGRVEFEIDFEWDGLDEPAYRFTRRAVLDVMKERLPEFDRPRINNYDWRYWHEVVDLLEMEILEDCDFESYGKFADADPERARAIKLALGIPEEYFEENVPILTAADRTRLEAMRVRLLKEDTRMYNRCKKTGKLV